MKDEYLKFLINEKKKWEFNVSHAIQIQHNPYANNGEQRLIECRLELQRITKEIADVLNSSKEKK